MLDLSELLVAWAAPIFISVVATVSRQLDRLNNRASRPFPVADGKWGFSGRAQVMASAPLAKN
jgi:hypothetical protein